METLSFLSAEGLCAILSAEWALEVGRSVRGLEFVSVPSLVDGLVFEGRSDALAALGLEVSDEVVKSIKSLLMAALGRLLSAWLSLAALCMRLKLSSVGRSLLKLGAVTSEVLFCSMRSVCFSTISTSEKSLFYICTQV